MIKELKIKDIKFDNPFFLAPLAGITDAPMRLLAKEQGASLVYSEMISAKGLWYQDKNTEKLLFNYENERPIAYQIFGSEPDIMSYAVKKLNDYPNVILDVNMGCPVPKVVKNGDGSSLMKNPDLVYDIISAMTKWSDKPITAKIRLGWDDEHINCTDIARAIEAGGADAVCVHGRTREQFYTGKANWEEIGEVKKAVNIPVIGNGDVTSWDDARKLMEISGCDFVMIGRAALGNPWIFRELNDGWKGRETGHKAGNMEIKNTLLRHIKLVADLKGDYSAIREMRKHIGWYIKGMKGAAKIRGRINQIDDLSELNEFIYNILK